MAEIAHIALNFARDPMACLLLAIVLLFSLIILSLKIWLVHGTIEALFLTVSLFFHEQRQMSFDAFLIGVSACPAVCHDIPNQLLVYRVGIYWFSAFTLIALCSYAAGDLVIRSPLHARDVLPTGLVSTPTTGG
ncbi:hypothetical protein [Ochrobactrum chromiisoli]|uniref:Uncharacterized protein n=1 Tax=Ochrobactrum chromiisoli TaxID=2993941 RepID=A0ABT3QTF4_9HYPH|nr:hypothetical protein [Ochrobactrum chromiisoli]MCX2698896.1 hypothetical protein [Ochrobactrum chromiisoli]